MRAGAARHDAAIFGSSGLVRTRFRHIFAIPTLLHCHQSTLSPHLYWASHPLTTLSNPPPSLPSTYHYNNIFAAPEVFSACSTAKTCHGGQFFDKPQDWTLILHDLRLRIHMCCLERIVYPLQDDRYYSQDAATNPLHQ